MDENAHAIRAGWKTGAHCQIYSQSKKKWYEGEVARIFNDKQGEWLKVRFSKSSIKQVRRYSSNIRPHSSNMSESLHYIVLVEEADLLVTGYMQSETTKINIDIPFDIIRLCLLFYHIKPICTKISKRLRKLIHGCYSNNIVRQRVCTKLIRIMLCNSNNPSIRKVMDSGVLPRIIRSCRLNKYPKLQYEALCILLNVTSGPTECTKHIICNGGHNVFIDLLQSPLYEIKEQALRALGNIAGDGQELKDLLLNNNILSNVLLICNSKFDEEYVTNFNNNKNINDNPLCQFINLLNRCSWTLSNLCRYSPPDIKHLGNLINCLRCLLQYALNMNDNDYNNNTQEIAPKIKMIMNIAWAFSYLTVFDACREQLVNKMDKLCIIQQFVQIMDHKNGQVRRPINRVIGNILSGSDKHVKICLDLGILSKYSSIINGLHYSSREEREICWSLSNICATDNVNDKLLVLKENLFEMLINCLGEKNNEALFAICNATTKYDDIIINHLIEKNVHNALCSFLYKLKKKFNRMQISKKKKNKLLLVAVDSIENILIVGEQNTCIDEENRFRHLFEGSGIIRFLEDLQYEEYVNDEVYSKCVNIIKKYFDGQSDEEC